jgi:hypothetical protein
VQEDVVYEEEDEEDPLQGVSKNLDSLDWQELLREMYMYLMESLIQRKEGVETLRHGIYYPQTFTSTANP